MYRDRNLWAEGDAFGILDFRLWILDFGFWIQNFKIIDCSCKLLENVRDVGRRFEILILSLEA